LENSHANAHLIKATALAEFEIDQSRALALIDTPLSQNAVENMDLDTLLRILDYGWLSDANRSGRTARPTSPSATEFGTWSIFGDFIGGNLDQSFDIVGHGMNSILHRSDRVRDWWYSPGNEDTAARLDA